MSTERIRPGAEALARAGEMGRRVAEYDWAGTSLGAIEGWPQSLRTSASMVLEASLPMIMYWGNDLLAIYNDAYRPLLGTKPEALGRPFDEVWSEALDVIRPVAEQALAGKASFFQDTPFTLLRFGVPEQAWFDWSFSPLRDESGAVAGILNACIEVTARVRAEEAVRASQARYRTIFESTDEGLAIAEILVGGNGEPVDYRFLELNSRFSDLTGISAVDALSGKTIREIVPGLEEKWFRIYGDIALTGEPRRFVEASEAMGRWFDVFAFRIDDPELRRVAILFKDITAEIESRSALEAAQAETVRREAAARARLEAALEQAPAAMCLLSGPDHVFTLANALYLQLTGNRPMVGKPIREAIPEGEGQGYYELLDQVYATGEPHVGSESPLMLDRTGNGDLESMWVNFVYAPMRNADGVVDGVFAHVYDVTEQVQARLAAEEARAAAEEAARAREEFLSIASHELRNPVAAIRGAAQMLGRMHERNQLSPERLERYVANLDSTSRHLARLTDDLLDLSRLQRGELPLLLEESEPAALVREVVRNERWEHRALHLRVEDGTPRALLMDSARVRQVIENLIDNAVKYSQDGTPVHLRLRGEGHGLLLEVQDFGIGLPPGAAESIFEPFGRAVNATEGHAPGLGLGLSISRRIAEQHGGWLRAESAGEGEGTTMTLWLPHRPPADLPRD